MMPLIGNLSDEYGRKAMLTLPMTVSIIPMGNALLLLPSCHDLEFRHGFSSLWALKKIPAILAYSRETKYFYAYYVVRTLTAVVSEGSIHCLALAYVADKISDRQRASGFGILSGVGSASFVCGTFVARFLSTASTFQVATLVSMLAAVHMRLFLKESVADGNALLQPILKGRPDVIKNISDSSRKTPLLIPSVQDLIHLLKSSTTFKQALAVAFFSSLADGGLQASLMYFLKARFHFNKNQFADMLLIAGVAGTISQLILMPMLVPTVGERWLLSVGLLMGCINMFLYSISWSSWVPYASTAFAVVVVFATPCLRSIASKQVGASEQGKAQGCISGISSFANIISPLIFSPLTALFLSEEPPFNFPGFAIMCIGLASVTKHAVVARYPNIGFLAATTQDSLVINQTGHLSYSCTWVSSAWEEVTLIPASVISSRISSGYLIEVSNVK